MNRFAVGIATLLSLPVLAEGPVTAPKVRIVEVH